MKTMAESNIKNNNTEDLFYNLYHLHPVDNNGNRRQNGDTDDCRCEPFNNEITKGWYYARKYVLDKLESERKWGAEGVMPSSSNRVHIVIHYNGDPMSLYIARQVALFMHFPNFKEGNGKTNAPSNTTVITILYNKKEDIIKLLRREEYLCNLPDVCRCTFVDWSSKEKTTINEYSYIDIELELVAFEKEDNFKDYKCRDYGSLQPIVISQGEINNVYGQKDVKLNMDVTNARRVNMVYNVGTDINNLPADDPNTAERYSKALLYFCYQQSQNDTLTEWNKLATYKKEEDRHKVTWQIKLRNKLSNVICADCFVTRLMSILSCTKREELKELIVNHETETLSKVKANLPILAQCEHARWNTEKLILGFAPFTPQDQYEDNRLFGSMRNTHRKKLKDNKAHHIDLCSYQDLRRRNPAEMKYDCFLIMAMVRILKENFEQIKTAEDEQRN